MTFMMAMIIIMVIPMVYFIKAVMASAAPDINAPPIYIKLAIVPGMLAAMGFMIGVLGGAATSTKMGETNFAPHLILASGVVGAGLYAFAAYRKGSAAVPGAPSRQGGAWILCAMASVYLAYTAVDHLTFIADKESSGILSTEIARQVGIECAAPYLLVRKQGNVFEYRCRHNLQLGSQYGQPFVPWPSYTAGSSEQLLVALEKLQAEAEQNRAGK